MKLLSLVPLPSPDGKLFLALCDDGRVLEVTYQGEGFEPGGRVRKAALTVVMEVEVHEGET